MKIKWGKGKGKRLGSLVVVLGFASVLSLTIGGSVTAAETNVATEADISVIAGVRTCTKSPPNDIDHSEYGRYFKVNGVNIRKSPSTRSLICAQGQRSHTLDYHCWTVGSDGHTWTYLRDATTNYAGWVRDSLLKGNGSHVHC